nr:NAD(P)-dependent oxidoreductase [bacterium]
MNKVIVFGGSGFIGNQTVKALFEKGFNVTIFDITPPLNIDKNIKFIKGDIKDLNCVRVAIENKDIVYNFAGIVDLDIANKSPYNAIYTNVTGNLNILEACVQNKVKRYIFASSIYVYSDKGSFYRCSKQMCEIMI